MLKASASREEYLAAVYKLQQDEHPVRGSKLSEYLGVSPAAITDMVKRLSDEGYVYRTKDLGICLTANGERSAISLVRKHRLAERFLTDVLGLSWDKAHTEAGKIEHVLSEEVEEGLERLLENPNTCPHGHPIPSKNGDVSAPSIYPLTSLKSGQGGFIVRISEEGPEMLKYLASLGLTPQTEIRVEEVAPFQGPLLVAVRGARYALGREVASKILIRKVIGGSAGGKRKRRRGK